MKRKTKPVHKKKHLNRKGKNPYFLYLGLFIFFLIVGIIIGKQITENKKRQILAEQKKAEIERLNKLKEKFSVKTVYTSVHD